MSPLEKLGLEVAAYRLLQSRGHASLLIALLNGRGTPISAEAVRDARAHRAASFREDSVAGGKVRICWLRRAMAEVGLAGLVKTTGSGSYSIPEPGRAAVIARLIEEASA